MNTMLAGMIGGWELVLILAVVLILFGAKKLPELAKGLGTGIKEFKKASREVTDELNRSMEEDHHNAPPPQRSVAAPQRPAAPAVEPAKTASQPTTETKA